MLMSVISRLSQWWDRLPDCPPVFSSLLSYISRPEPSSLSSLPPQSGVSSSHWGDSTCLHHLQLRLRVSLNLTGKLRWAAFFRDQRTGASTRNFNVKLWLLWIEQVGLSSHLNNYNNFLYFSSVQFLRKPRGPEIGFGKSATLSSKFLTSDCSIRIFQNIFFKNQSRSVVQIR